MSIEEEFGAFETELRAAQRGELRRTMMAAFDHARMDAARRSALVRDTPDETKVAVIEWWILTLAKHLHNGGTMRGLVVGRLGFVGYDAAVLLDAIECLVPPEPK